MYTRFPTRRACTRRLLTLTLALWLALLPLCSDSAIAQSWPSVVNLTVDFTYLHMLAPDSVAWLYQPNTTINQPVVYSADESYYLTHRFHGRQGDGGALFITGDEPPSFDDPLITIYGRNRLNETMFGTLSLYKDGAYYRNHPTLYLLTPEGNFQLDVFAGVCTSLTGKDSWLPPSDSLMDALPGILESSFITPLPSTLPLEGDGWMVLANAAPPGQGARRYVLYARKRPIIYAPDAATAFINQIDMDSRVTQNGVAKVPGVGQWMLYAQNDPLWADLTFEYANSYKRRPFGDGGCGPTAIAMAIANLVDKQDLPRIRPYALSPYGYRFCTCSVNENFCTCAHLLYQVTSADQFQRYFPLVVAGFATGNNIWQVRGRGTGYGTSLSYLSKICGIYGLSVTKASFDEAMEALQNDGCMAVSCVINGGRSPFTKSSHFVTLAHVQDGYLYVLDPLRRDDYLRWDSYNVLEIITPGLVRLTVKEAARSGFAQIYLLQKEEGR